MKEAGKRDRDKKQPTTQWGNAQKQTSRGGGHEAAPNNIGPEPGKIVDMNCKVEESEHHKAKIQSAMRRMKMKDMVIAALNHYYESFPLPEVNPSEQEPAGKTKQKKSPKASKKSAGARVVRRVSEKGVGPKRR
ncbi:hypothetical protein SAMN05444161_4715 [Rhizobiales bacterium GAS191]|nr:hypothetical protein SAMN05444161_4715 [Rhizobiales bacterium GAS191]